MILKTDHLLPWLFIALSVFKIIMGVLYILTVLKRSSKEPVMIVTRIDSTHKIPRIRKITCLTRNMPF